MTEKEKQDLLEEAKKRYPIGTECICLTGKKPEIINSELIWNLHHIKQLDAPCTRIYDSLENTWAKIISKHKEEKRKYTISELKYPIAIHITSKEQHDKLKELDIPEYESGYNYYLLGGGRSKTKYGGLSFGAGNYINIEFEDVVFPEEITKEQIMENIVVKCDSLEEWDIVQKFCNINYSYKLSKDGCIRLSDGIYWSISDKEAIQKEGYKVISFNDFKKEYLKDEIFIPKYVECINNGYFISSCSEITGNPLKNGRIYKIHSRKPTSMYDNRICLDIEGKYVEIGCDRDQILYNPSTKEAYDAQFAKKEEPINTYGLKVGDKLPANILNAWGVKNNYVNIDGNLNSFGAFSGDRIINTFYETKHGVIFKPSDCSDDIHGLKVEGFKEFMDNFDKPMPKSGEYWVYIRGVNKTSLNNTDSIYKIGYNLDKPNKFNITEIWCNDSRLSSNIAYEFSDMKNWRIATSEDLKVLEPKETPYKNRFKVGDIVKYINTGINNDHDQSCYFGGVVGSGVYDSYLELVTEPKKQSLKGRYLKALVDSPSAITSAKKGDYFRIDDEYRISCTLLRNNTSHWSCTCDSSFELMPEGFNPTQLNNKVIDLTKTKIWIGDNPQLSKQVQEKAFELGWRWSTGKDIKYLQGTSLYFDSRRYITYSSSKTSDYFNNQKYKEIKPQDLGISYPIIVGETAGNIPNSQFYAIRYDPFETEIKPKIDENVLLKPIKKITLDTSVNKVTSINTELVKPKTIIYF